MIGIVAYSTINGVSWSTICRTLLAQLYRTCQFLHSGGFHNDILPMLVEDPLDVLWDINDLAARDYLIGSVNVSIVQLVEPECVSQLAVLFEIADL